MLNMADLAVYLLLSQWLTAPQDDDPNRAHLTAALGDLGQALQRRSQEGEGEGLLAGAGVLLPVGDWRVEIGD